jgi:hypothetical protein
MLMRYRDENGQGWAHIIDLLTMYPDARRKVGRIRFFLRAGAEQANNAVIRAEALADLRERYRIVLAGSRIRGRKLLSCYLRTRSPRRPRLLGGSM